MHMKIMFLHLSDAHLKMDTELDHLNRPAIVDSLARMGQFDECIIIFSGDIAFAGDAKAYEVAGRLVGFLAKWISRKYLSGKYINIVLVPGNHDNCVVNPDRNNLNIEEYYSTGVYEEKFKSDLRQLDKFFYFANKNGCFKKIR